MLMAPNDQVDKIIQKRLRDIALWVVHDSRIWEEKVTTLG
jgi:hypothetical protein